MLNICRRSPRKSGNKPVYLRTSGHTHETSIKEWALLHLPGVLTSPSQPPSCYFSLSFPSSLLPPNLPYISFLPFHHISRFLPLSPTLFSLTLSPFLLSLFVHKNSAISVRPSRRHNAVRASMPRLEFQLRSNQALTACPASSTKKAEQKTPPVFAATPPYQLLLTYKLRC